MPSPGKKAARPAPRADPAVGEAAVLAKIAAMPGPYRAMGERLHAVIMKSAPSLTPRVRYGMPWYFKDDKSICFFRVAKNYLTFGFDDDANLSLDEGPPHQLLGVAFGIKQLDAAPEAKLATLITKAAS
ncbi:MAG: DUF1801 domain-containing protein [Thermoplasmata archaeon]|nr:DUF1801 domain-containing protein [Thermoplasmata archaeon]